jgi:hypothetical protein
MTIKEKLQNLSEDDLRQKVIIPLLLTLGCSDAVDNCGPTEKGKDIIYEIPHFLKDSIYGAVILKNDHDLRSSDLDRGLKVQVDKALNKFNHRKDPRVETKVHELILITAFNITESVRTYFLDNCGSNFPNIHFVDGNRLEFLIRTTIIAYTDKTDRDYIFDVGTFNQICNELSSLIAI